jgi:hypothetical protein
MIKGLRKLLLPLIILVVLANLNATKEGFAVQNIPGLATTTFDPNTSMYVIDATYTYNANTGTLTGPNGVITPNPCNPPTLVQYPIKLEQYSAPICPGALGVVPSQPTSDVFTYDTSSGTLQLPGGNYPPICPTASSVPSPTSYPPHAAIIPGLVCVPTGAGTSPVPETPWYESWWFILIICILIGIIIKTQVFP